jgi:hypothetical protein
LSSDATLTVRELADYLQVDPSTIYRLLRAGLCQLFGSPNRGVSLVRRSKNGYSIKRESPRGDSRRSESLGDSGPRCESLVLNPEVCTGGDVCKVHGLLAGYLQARAQKVACGTTADRIHAYDPPSTKLVRQGTANQFQNNEIFVHRSRLAKERFSREYRELLPSNFMRSVQSIVYKESAPQ